MWCLIFVICGIVWCVLCCMCRCGFFLSSFILFVGNVIFCVFFFYWWICLICFIELFRLLVVVCWFVIFLLVLCNGKVMCLILLCLCMSMKLIGLWLLWICCMMIFIGLIVGWLVLCCKSWLIMVFGLVWLVILIVGLCVVKCCVCLFVSVIVENWFGLFWVRMICCVGLMCNVLWVVCVLLWVKKSFEGWLVFGVFYVVWCSVVLYYGDCECVFVVVFCGFVSFVEMFE